MNSFIGKKNSILSLITISILVLFPIGQSYGALIPFMGSSIIPNSISRVVTSNDTVYSNNYSSPITLKGNNVSITGSNTSKTVYFTVTTGTLPPTTYCSTNYGFTAYNQTSNSFRCQLLNQTGAGSGVSSLNALTGALTIQGVSGNTTVTTGSTSITVNTAWNVVTTGLAAQEITKQLTLDTLVLGGNANGNNKSFISLNQVNATKFFQNGNQVVDTLQANSPLSVSQNHGNSITISCSTCSTSSGTVIGSQNIGKGTGSIGVLAAPTSTLIQGKNVTAGTGISLSGNTTDITISTTDPHSALTSINSQTGPVISIVRQLGNTTITNNTNSIVIGFGINPVIIGGSAQTVTKGLTLNSLTLGGQMNIAGNTFSNSGHVYTWPSNTGTVRLTNTTALVNYTKPSNPATTTSTTGVMSNLFATFTPATTGNIFIQICGGMTSGTAGDGAGFDIRYGTSLISEGTAIGNTKVGTEQIITASTVSKFQSACSISYVSGLTLNQKLYIQIGKYAVTGGTATFQNFETYVEEK